MKIAKVFISYAHSDEDAPHYQALDARLNILSDCLALNRWSDRRVVAGEEYQQKITSELEDADVIILLVSPDFRKSEFIRKVELPLALKRRNTGDAAVIAVLARPASFGDFKPLSRDEALPKTDTGKLLPVANWPNADDAWESVYGGLKDALTKYGVAPRMEGDFAMAVDVALQGARARPTSTGARVIEYQRITDFWNAEPNHQEGRLVSIAGTLSRYAPFVVAPPLTKREMHLEFREKLAERKSLPEVREGRVNAMLAFTAGQMVWRLNLPRVDSVYLGFYQSIVRNAVPVFVDRQYYGDKVDPIFSVRGCSTTEVQLTGRVTHLPNDFVEEFTDERILGTTIIRPRIVPIRDRPNYGIFVDGKGTGIEYIGRTKYLDGDIWVALKWEDKRLFRSRFCDIADDADVAQQMQALKGEIHEKHKGHEVILQFDQENPNFMGEQALGVSELVEQMF